MKRLLLLVAVLGAFAFTAMAQDTSASSSTSGQTTSKTSKSSKKKSSDMAMDQSGGAAAGTKTGKAGKSSTLTGCVSSSPNSEGMYTLSNGRYKNGVEIGPADKVKDHAGHQVALTGKWGTAAQAGETNASSKEKGERHFDVDSVKHISDTCSTAPGGGTTGSKMKGGKKGSKSGADSTATPKGF